MTGNVELSIDQLMEMIQGADCARRVRIKSRQISMSWSIESSTLPVMGLEAAALAQNDSPEFQEAWSQPDDPATAPTIGGADLYD
jgi:hypothetical protein